MASFSITIQTPHTSILKSTFLGKTFHFHLLPHKTFPSPKQPSNYSLNPSAKFNLFEILGGRGLCNGEEGLQKELERTIAIETNQEQKSNLLDNPEIDQKIPEDGFEKELMGLTGGFPGGEKGLIKFIEENPVPKKPSISESSGKIEDLLSTKKKPKAPELPLLMPGMIAIVKNENSPYYMYCGIVQRITDGKAGVLFEGGNWDRLITFRLEELERREKGPPMKNPRSAVLEPFLKKEGN